MIAFWSLAISENTTGISITTIISYFMIASFISDIVMVERLDFSGHVSDNIRNGGINTILIRPVKVLIYLYFDILGKRLVNITLGFLLFAVALIIHPPASIFAVFNFFIFLNLAIILGIGINIIVSSITFFVTDNTFFAMAIAQTIRILGGSFIPLYFFSEQIASVIQKTFLPFLVFKPIDALNKVAFSNEIFIDVIVAIVWIVILHIIALLLWRYGIQKYEAIGI